MFKSRKGITSKIIIIGALILTFWVLRSLFIPPPDTKTVDDIIHLINQNASEIDHTKYITISMEETKLLFNRTNEAKTVDEDLCNIMYNFTLRNKTDKNINLKFKAYLPKELTTTIIYGDTTIGSLTSSPIELIPGQGINAESGILMKHYNKLTTEEKEIYEKYKNTLYLELIINNKKAYTKIGI